MRKDLSGEIFGKLKVLKYVYDHNKRSWWECQCECGNIVIKNGHNLQQGKTKSCGCIRKYHMPHENLIGHIFTLLTVINETRDNNHMLMWECQCECGNIVKVYPNNLKKGTSRSCGCLKRKRISDAKGIDLTNNKIGRLLVKTLIMGDSSNKRRYECVCDCGNIKIVPAANLLRGDTKSCGCIRKELRRDKLYNWRHDLSDEDRKNMKNRSFQPENLEWKTAVFKRDNYTCQITNKKGYIQAHHLNSWNNHIEQRFIVENGITLLRDIHKLFHTIYGRGYNTTEQFTEFQERFRKGEFDDYLKLLQSCFI